MKETYKTSKIEMDFPYLCTSQYKRVLLLMKEVEEHFEIDLRNIEHKDLRHKFLDVANFFKKLPEIRGEANEH